MTTTPEPAPQCSPEGDPLVDELVETLEVWALAAPATPGDVPATGRRRARRAGVLVAAAATVAAVTVGIGVAVGGLGSGHEGTAAAHAPRDPRAGCDAATVAHSDGPPAVELRLIAPARATSGTSIRVQVQGRSLDGKAHDLVTGVLRGLEWVRQGRVMGRDDGPERAMAISHHVPADGSWTTLSWGDQPSAEQEVVGGCTQMIDNGGRRAPLAPGRYQLVIALTDVGTGGGDQPPTYVSPPVAVEVVAPDPDEPATVTVFLGLPPAAGATHPEGAVRVEAGGRLVREVPLTAARMTLTLPGGTYRLVWSLARSCATTLTVAPAETSAWAALECTSARPRTS